MSRIRTTEQARLIRYGIWHAKHEPWSTIVHGLITKKHELSLRAYRHTNKRLKR